MPASSTDGLRTLLLGVDAACRPVIDDLRPDGTIPTIESLLESGATGPLESQLPPWTPSAWPSMYTGVNPGRHGVYGFLRFDGYDWDVVTRTDVRERAIWETLSERDVTSVVVNVPVTHPPEPFDGALVPGYMAPETPECHPNGLLSELRDELGEYRLYNEQLSEGASDAQRKAGYLELIEQRGEAFRYLVDEYDPGFGFVQWQQTDTIFHEFPDDETTIRRIYRAVDREIEAILDAYDPEVVLLASDHGIGPYEGHEFRINSFLRDRGYAETVADGEGMPSWAAIDRSEIDADGEDDDGDGVGRAVARRALSTAAAMGVTAQRIGRVLETVGLDEFVLERVPADVVRAATERVAFEDSTAFARDRIECGVRINLAGREPDGTVAPDAYESVRAELIEALEAVRTPDGRPVFESVLPREAVFDGPYVEDAPDVVLVPTDWDNFLKTTVHDDVFEDELMESHNHKRDGIVIAAGAGVDAEADLADAHLFDVAPTILATFGLPAAERMDGLPLPVVDDAGRESYPPFRPSRDHRSTPGSGVEDRLSDLGYLEQ